MNSITNFRAFFTNGIQLDNPENFRQQIIRLFRLLGIPALIYFTAQDFSRHHWDEAALTLTILVIFILTIRQNVTTANSKWMLRIAMGSLVVNFIYLLVINPDAYLVTLWMYLIPLPVALLFGVGEGLAWIALTAAASFLALTFSTRHPGLEVGFIFRFGFTYLVLGTLSLIAEYVREQTQRMYQEKQQELTLLNERISGKVLLDSLTGGYNREFLNEMLPGLVQLSVHSKVPLSIILCDIDEFKDANDSLGHVAGDDILRNTAAVFLNNLRSGTDYLIRYGGDEFLILLRNTKLEDAVRLAERLRLKVMEQTMTDEQLEVTCSFGVTELLPSDLNGNLDKTGLKVINRADEHLYRAKKQGKNQVVSS